MRRRLLPLVLVSLMLTSSMASVLGASGREVMDNWEDGDAFVEISLISWVANQTEEWDSSGGLPDPQFRICFDVDGEDLDCVNTPTWENQWELNATWNYTIDIPDTSNLLNITIECEDNDAFNDDECDMNADVNEWKLYAEYNWSQNPNMTISGNGDGDGNGTWKNAASVWEVKVFGFGDGDADGVPDNLDFCPNTTESFGNVNQTVFPGCSWGQLDIDGDGIISSLDEDPFDSRIGLVDIGSRTIEITSAGMPVNPGSVSCRGNVVSLVGLLWNQSTTSNHCEAGDPLRSKYLDINGSGIHDVNAIEWGVDKDYLDSEILSEHCVRRVGFGHYMKMDQLTPTSEVLVHCYTQENYPHECTSSVFILGAGGIVPLLEFVDDQRGTGTICKGYEGNSFGNTLSHLGAFGDLNGDGILDFVHYNSFDNRSIPKDCVVYFGQKLDSNFSFHQYNLHECTGHGGIEIADFDNDGFDDIITDKEIIFFNDDGVLDKTTISTYGEAQGSVLMPQVFDYDMDGDLDIIMKSSDDWLDDDDGIVYTTIITNAGKFDQDFDGVADNIDDCPNTASGDVVDSNGCSDSQRDTDLDGVNDASDQCPWTQLGHVVNLQGCASNQYDFDGDGILDSMDLCPTTPRGESTNLDGCSQSEIDTDGDGVVNSNDACPGTAQGSIVDANGCSESDVVDNDADGDGVVDTYDACPSTIVGSTVDQNGCSDAQLDIDGDGVANTRDQCPGTSSGAEVSYYGCSASQGDEDLDGVLNVDDDCPGSWFVDKDNPPETSNGCDGMLESQDDDDDGDGLVDTYDECPDTPAGQSVDAQGCTAAQRETLSDDAAAEGDTGDTIAGMFCCFGLLWLVFSATTKSRKKSSTPPRYVQAPPQVIHQQSIHQQQQVMRELENQRRQAEHQVAQLQQQLHQSNQMSATQLASVQSQLSDMQQQVTATNMAKTDMQRELEQMKAQEVERNTLTESPVNIQDSAVAGDSLIGSTKIENQTVNDADAIARAAAAAAIDAYRMGLDDRER